MRRSVRFQPADSEREAEEVDGVKGNAGCVTDMSFLYTPEYFQQVFHMNRKAHSSTNEFVFFVFLYIYNGGITERRLALLWK